MSRLAHFFCAEYHYCSFDRHIEPLTTISQLHSLRFHITRSIQLLFVYPQRSFELFLEGFVAKSLPTFISLLRMYVFVLMCVDPWSAGVSRPYCELWNVFRNMCVFHTPHTLVYLTKVKSYGRCRELHQWHHLYCQYFLWSCNLFQQCLALFQTSCSVWMSRYSSGDLVSFTKSIWNVSCWHAWGSHFKIVREASIAELTQFKCVLQCSISVRVSFDA